MIANLPVDDGTKKWKLSELVTTGRRLDLNQRTQQFCPIYRTANLTHNKDSLYLLGTADHLKLVLSVIDGPVRFAMKDE